VPREEKLALPTQVALLYHLALPGGALKSVMFERLSDALGNV